jgi:hypothetical protein
MALPKVADGEDGLHIWRVAANILNKQLRGGGPLAWGLGVGLTTLTVKNKFVTKCFTGPRMVVWTGFIWLRIGTSGGLL